MPNPRPENAPFGSEKPRRHPQDPDDDGSSSTSSTLGRQATQASGREPGGFEEIRTTRTRRPSRPFDAQLERVNTTLSIVRSRRSRTRPPFDHVLSHQVTGKDVIVTYDGDDDPCKSDPCSKPSLSHNQIYGTVLTLCRQASKLDHPPKDRDYSFIRLHNYGLNLRLFSLQLWNSTHRTSFPRERRSSQPGHLPPLDRLWHRAIAMGAPERDLWKKTGSLAAILHWNLLRSCHSHC
jgi:hypothetical protein